MNLQLVRIYGIFISALAFLGLFVSGHLFALTNTDTVLDTVRIILAIYLLYAGFFARDDRTVNTALFTVGSLYVGLGVLGLISPTLGGLLPSGLTGFDIVFHLATGALAVYAGLDSRRHVAAH
jgi:hypothetical protein